METEVNVRTADVINLQGARCSGCSCLQVFMTFFCIFLTSKNIVWFQFGLINRKMTPPC